ncbi:hydroxyproline-rich glycoprotein family protein [Striga asiatica]|uniref:Hydroxyproline-rich glycoprotein family protein n=1 Tax=Striga asiatica TaxID=4170 RepID=A0A5A7PGZ2_STRAF|nr:hydroxyproline-rich glycoprotein family protein [Striga asiatica]
MIVRLGFVVAASIAAYAVKQISVKNSNPADNSLKDEREDREDVRCSTNGLTGVVAEQEEEEEKEEVKQISSIINPTLSTPSDFDDELLPEFESLLSGEIDFPLPTDKFSSATAKDLENDRIYENEMANNESELVHLRNLVKELEEREVKLEGELLEYYGLKEQESSIAELQKQLKIKTVEIDMLNITISSLQAERKKLQEEISQGAAARKELELTKKKLKDLQKQIQMEANQTKGQLLLLKQQVSGLRAKEQEAFQKEEEVEKKLKSVKELEVEVMELKRKNKELQHEKRELVVKLDAAEANVKVLSDITETEMVAKVREEANTLRHMNEDLVKQVEGLQMNRFSEVEELVYLRWVNACLRFELRNYQNPTGKISARDLNKSLSPRSQERAKQLMLDYAGSERGGGGADTDLDSNFDNMSVDSSDLDNTSIDSSTSRLTKKPGLLHKLKRWGGSKPRDGPEPGPGLFSSPVRPNKGPLEALMLRNAGDGMAITSFGTGEQEDNIASSFKVMSMSVDGVVDEKYPAYKDRHKLALEREKQIKEKAQLARAVKFGDNVKAVLPPKLSLIKEKPVVASPGESNDLSVDSSSAVVSKMQLTQIEKRAPRVLRPPPKPSGGGPAGPNVSALGLGPGGPPLPPPPPPPGGPPRPPPPPGTHLRGIGGERVHRAPELVEFYQTLMKREAKKDSSSGLVVAASSNTSDARTDVETQGDFVQSLATEVRAASFNNVDDLVAFVNWLDEELSFLVDERAVLKHFDWPEGKADALREAAFEYQDLMKLEKQVSSFTDDPSLPCEAALKKMYKLLEKVEQSVYALLRTRDMAVSRYKEFGIPVDWLLDSGVVGKIKLSSVQLARNYMNRVASELDAMNEPEKEPNKEFLILQGVRFAFRVHQFAGGFDAESMKAFEELRGRAHAKSAEESKPEE